MKLRLRALVPFVGALVAFLGIVATSAAISGCSMCEPDATDCDTWT